MTLIGFTTPLGKAVDPPTRRVILKLVRRANTETVSPTSGQAEAGNYKKGRMTLHGLPIVVETPAGELRKGIGHDGKPWQQRLKHTYGYISRTEGKDGDHVDVIIGPHPESEAVFVCNQLDHKGRFDEHKCVLSSHAKESRYFVPTCARISVTLWQSVSKFR